MSKNKNSKKSISIIVSIKFLDKIMSLSINKKLDF